MNISQNKIPNNKSHIRTIPIDTPKHTYILYRSGMDNSKSFVSNDFLPIKWKYELTVFKSTMFKLTMHFRHEIIGKHFTETLNKVEL